MDAFALLKADHKKVASLFDKLEAASGKAKLGVFKKIKNELDLHSHLEEKHLYPALEKPTETHDLTLEAYEEHNVVKTLLSELASSTSANDEWQAKAKVLRENVEHHVKEEENELFDKAKDALTDRQIERVGRRMEAEKARKLGRPVPKLSTDKKSDAVKAKTAKPGIFSKLANLIGLGADASDKKRPAAKKGSAKAKSASKTSSTVIKKTKLVAAKKASKSPAKKPQSAKSGSSFSAAKATKSSSRKPKSNASTARRAATPAMKSKKAIAK